MRIEERCSCGAQIVLSPNQWEGGITSRDRSAVAEHEAWKQIDRWRKLHAGCRAPTLLPAVTTTIPRDPSLPRPITGTGAPLPEPPTTTCKRGNAQGPG